MKNSNLIFVFLLISLSFYLSSCQSDLEIDKGIKSSELSYTSLFDEAELVRVLKDSGFHKIEKVEWRESNHEALRNMESRPHHKELIYEATK